MYGPGTCDPAHPGQRCLENARRDRGIDPGHILAGKAGGLDFLKIGPRMLRQIGLAGATDLAGLDRGGSCRFGSLSVKRQFLRNRSHSSPRKVCLSNRPRCRAAAPKVQAAQNRSPISALSRPKRPEIGLRLLARIPDVDFGQLCERPRALGDIIAKSASSIYFSRHALDDVRTGRGLRIQQLALSVTNRIDQIDFASRSAIGRVAQSDPATPAAALIFYRVAFSNERVFSKKPFEIVPSRG